MKYLYYTERYYNRVRRALITRETDSNIWIKNNGETEIKISKKTMRLGSGYDVTYFCHETPELLSRWASANLKAKFKNKLKELEKCNDESVMRAVLEIKIEEVVK